MNNNEAIRMGNINKRLTIKVVLKLDVYVVCFTQMKELIVNRRFQNY